MKTYQIYIFSQDGCGPCSKLKNYITTLPEADQKELHFVPLRHEEDYTPLAVQFEVTLTPTLLVVHEEQHCKLELDGDEYCDPVEIEVERFVGAQSIIENLDSTIDAYTYAHPE